MQILKGIEIKGKALWHAKKKILIIGDIHIGYEEAMRADGVFAPRTTFSELKKEIEELLLLKPKLIIINGDIKHEFGRISNQEWKDALDFLDLLLKSSKVILIKGNHDNFLEPIAIKRGIDVKDFYFIDNICITHGHKIFLQEKVYNKKIRALIIGHEHPAVSITDGVKTESYKCFLKGEWKGKTLVVMPSFFSVFEGSNVKREKLLSPYLDERTIGNFEVYVIGDKDKVYKFGKLKSIK
jgi:uncharacterized protein